MPQASVERARGLRLFVAFAVGALLVGFTLGPWVRAQATTAEENTAPIIGIGPDGAVENVPQQMAPGYTRFALETPADNGATLPLYRLKSGATLEELQPALEAVDMAFSGAGDPTEAINSALEIADIVAELDLEPGLSDGVGLVMAEGEYVLDYAPYPMEEGAMPARTFRTFTVGGEVEAETPPADVDVEMVDFSFVLPADISAGQQVWRVRNAGEQLHHTVMFRLNEDATLDQMMAWMETEEGPPPGEPAAYVGIMSPGYAADYTLDLTAGNYVAICFMPDHRGDASGMPHFMLGMVQEFQVAGE